MSDSVFLTDGNGTLTGLVDSAYAGELVIPEYVGSERITCIGFNAFYGCENLTSVIIGDSVTTIKSQAFADSNGLTSIYIPNSVTSIKDYVFWGCRKLTTIYVQDPANPPASVANYDWAEDGLSGITFAKYIKPVDMLIKNTTLIDIADAIREKNGSTDTYTPAQMASAIYELNGGGGESEEEWFEDGNTHIWIHLEEGRTSPVLGCCPNGRVTVDWGDGTTPDVLTGTSTSTVKWTPTHNYVAAGDYVITLVVDGSMGVYGDQSSGSAILRAVSSYDMKNYYYRNAVQKMEMGNGVTSISTYAFYYCYNLKSVIIPDGITSVANYVFRTCSALSSVYIPESVTSIENNVFYDCYALSSVYIPESVTSIGSYAFYNCYALSSVYIPESVTSIGSYAFYNCQHLYGIDVPDGVTSIGDYFLYNCYSLARFSVPESATSIGSNAFNKCYSLAKLRFNSINPPTVSNSNAFSNIPTDCVISVPVGSLAAYTSATNYPSSATYTYIEED